ncbi:MAG TPA: hypothetical protein VFW44_14730 [Bryobacteraceae bacterium]|nr:hypothetical protein [Bryobacteraceae bacterium]
MPKNDEGEFELVLGNKQLISVFVIVVVLLGVFFSMGYIVGRNSSGAAETARNEKAKNDREADTTPAPGDDTTAPALDSSPSSADSTAPESTRPAQSEEPTAAKPEPARSKEAARTKEDARPKEEAKAVKPKPSPAPPPVSKPSPSGAPVHAAAAGEPSSGQYWQVVATARPDAEIIAEALGKKGFHVVVAPAPKDGIFRVLVGPLPDAPTMASTRTNLEAAGFKSPIIRKY